MDPMIQYAVGNSKDRAYLSQDNEILAEMNDSKAGAHLLIIDHTEVSENSAGKVLEEFVECDFGPSSEE